MALEARALDRDTRGFISMTMTSPFAGLTANCTLAPPVATPISRMIARAPSRRRCSSRSVRVIAGATVIESPVCTPIGSMFSIEQTTAKLPTESLMTSSSYSFQPSTLCSTRTSRVGDWARAHSTLATSSPSLQTMPPPAPPRVNEGRRMAG